MMNECELKVLLGKTMASVKASDDEIIFETVDGEKYKLYHSQDCCEQVYIESVVGDLNDLVGEPLLMCDEVVSNEEPADVKKDKLEWMDDSVTWTFYKFATRKGYVDVRWVGSSNGYYSESVDFCQIEMREE